MEERAGAWLPRDDDGKPMALIHPVILSGGTGTRLWPLSRQSYPKQLQALAGPHTLLQAAALRAADREIFAPPMVVANVEHRFVIAEQLRAIGIGDARLVLEPEGRNTAAAVAVAALLAADADAEAVILVMPSDHVIADEAAFVAAVEAALPAAEGGALVLFGMEPTRPETGYGYIRPGEALADGPVRKVAAFVEKPDVATAERYLADGYVWNSGIFLLPAAGTIEALRRHAPEVLEAAEAAIVDGGDGSRFLPPRRSLRQRRPRSRSTAR